MEKSEPAPSSEFQENLNLLRQIDIFSGLPLEAVKVLAYLSSRETFRQGDLLFQQKDDDGRAFYIIAGKANLIYRDNGEDHPIRSYTVGDFFGSLALFGSARRLFSMEAMQDTTCLTITREKFSKTIAQFPDLLPKIIKMIVADIHQWEKQFLAHQDAALEPCLRYVGISLV
jgi:CRP-like cAMP-binding protein